MLLIYETHSTSTDNEAGVASGHHDPDLSPLGLEQAAELGRRRTENVAAVYCSDLLRTRRTAEIAFAHRRIPILADARLRECNFGLMNGAPARDVHAAAANHVFEPFPGGESYADVAGRVRAFLAGITSGHREDTVVIVAHRAPHHALEHLLHGRDLAAVVTAPWQWQPGWTYEVTP
jgi:broad specificity phosphatase PhoE